MKKSSRAQLKIFSHAEYCNGKRTYDKKGAQTAQNARYKQDHIELRIYPCPDCHGWHLTKQVRSRY